MIFGLGFWQGHKFGDIVKFLLIRFGLSYIIYFVSHNGVVIEHFQKGFTHRAKPAWGEGITEIRTYRVTGKCKLIFGLYAM